MPDCGQFARDISRSYDQHIVDEHKQLALLILIAFLLTFTAVRLITHAIKDDRFHRVLHNIGTKGGTHIHHLVPGILLLLISGFCGIGLRHQLPGEPFAVLFGIGAALTLDEFALWLHLEDVYWAKEGRQSVDAVVIAATIVLLAVLGASFWIDIGRAIGRLL
jgi:hypothetical protein